MAGIELGSAAALAAAIRAKEISSRELLDAYLDRIDRLNGPVNAVVTIDAEGAVAAATAADAATARGEFVGPLHGLPTTIKDAIEVGGLRSTGGAAELTGHVPVADAPAVARLRAAGAVVFGKTNVPRWSGDAQAYNDIFGTTNNPWDLAKVPGGSSGGAAAAVACGFTSFEVGTDIGGSVRIPSHCCGVYGLKPSFGAVSQRGYLDQVGGGTTDADINVFGPIARSAADLELLLGVLAGPDADRAVGWRLELPAPRRSSLGEYRVGIWFDDPSYPVDAEYRRMLESAAAALQAAGVKVEDARPPVDMAEQVALFSALVMPAVSVSASEAVGREIAGNHRDWIKRDQEREASRRTWARWFEQYDLLLAPVIPVPAFAHDQSPDLGARTLSINGETRPYLDVVGWTGLIGVVYLPSAVIPVGRTAAGLPVGMQIVAPYLRDRDALDAARRFDEVIGGYAVPPSFA